MNWFRRCVHWIYRNTVSVVSVLCIGIVVGGLFVPLTGVPLTVAALGALLWVLLMVMREWFYDGQYVRICGIYPLSGFTRVAYDGYYGRVFRNKVIVFTECGEVTSKYKPYSSVIRLVDEREVKKPELLWKKHLFLSYEHLQAEDIGMGLIVLKVKATGERYYGSITLEQWERHIERHNRLFKQDLRLAIDENGMLYLCVDSTGERYLGRITVAEYKGWESSTEVESLRTEMLAEFDKWVSSAPVVGDTVYLNDSISVEEDGVKWAMLADAPLVIEELLYEEEEAISCDVPPEFRAVGHYIKNPYVKDAESVVSKYLVEASNGLRFVVDANSVRKTLSRDHFVVTKEVEAPDVNQSKAKPVPPRLQSDFAPTGLPMFPMLAGGMVDQVLPLMQSMAKMLSDTRKAKEEAPTLRAKLLCKLPVFEGIDAGSVHEVVNPCDADGLVVMKHMGRKFQAHRDKVEFIEPSVSFSSEVAVKENSGQSSVAHINRTS